MIDHHHYSAQAIALLFEQSGHHTAEFRDSLERCPTCSLALQEYSNWLVALEHTNPLVALEYCTRHRLFETLSRKSASERWELVAEDSLFHRWGLAQLLLEEARRCLVHAPGHSDHLLSLVLEILPRLDLATYGQRSIQDLWTKTYLALVEVRFQEADLEAVGELISRARWSLAEGTGRRDLARQLDHVEARFHLENVGLQEVLETCGASALRALAR